MRQLFTRGSLKTLRAVAAGCRPAVGFLRHERQVLKRAINAPYAARLERIRQRLIYTTLLPELPLPSTYATFARGLPVRRERQMNVT